MPRPPIAVLLLALALALPASALASEVRLRTEHPKASVSGSKHEYLLLRTGETLRGAVIGPKKVRIVLRRAGTSAGEVRAKLKRDGRDEGTLKVGGRPSAKIDGHEGRAGAEVDKVISVPAGPHTLSVELLGGDGELLVAFTAPEPPKRVARAEQDDPAPAPLVPAKPPEQPAEEEPALALLPTAEQPAAPVAEDDGPAPAPLVLPAEGSKVADATPARPAAAPTRLGDDEEPEAPAPTTRVIQAVPGTLPVVTADAPKKAGPDGPSRFPLWIGARAGLAGQTQFGSAGTGLGLHFRSGLFADAGAQATRGVIAGVAADWVRYAMAFDLGASRGLPELRQEVTIQAFPLLAEVGYALGSADGRLTPVVGLLGGVTFSRVASSGFTEQQQAWLSPALGLFAGIEYGVGRNRFGFDVRYLSSRTGDSSAARNFEVGGLLAQASWRFGL